MSKLEKQLERAERVYGTQPTDFRTAADVEREQRARAAELRDVLRLLAHRERACATNGDTASAGTLRDLIAELRAGDHRGAKTLRWNAAPRRYEDVP